MSAEILDDEVVNPNEFEAVEAQQQEQVTESEAPQVEEVPEKFRNKTPTELIRMYQEAERLLGRQAQEVGEIRKLADQLIQERLVNKPQPSPQPSEPELTDVDFFADPVQAVNRAVEKHPAVMQARMSAAQMQRRDSLDRLTRNHPDYKEVVQDPSFRQWVEGSRIRQQLFQQADRNFDFDAANELLGTYKGLQARRAETVQNGAAELKKETDKSLKAASVPSGGSGETSKKIYRRADLIDLQIRNPDRYDALQPEIMQAYAEGRVR